MRFFKHFPDGHSTAFQGPFGQIVGYCSARGAIYLVGSLGNVRGISTRVIDDAEVAAKWEGTFINLGSSASNCKTNDVKQLPENPWLADDLGVFKFKDGRVISNEARADKGIILKLTNPYFPKHSLLVCAGLGEWGTSGAAWFLATHWRALSRRFGENPFLVVIAVIPGSDESAREIEAFGVHKVAWFRRLWGADKQKGSLNKS